jgi:tetratricopeptide (TPR) repeat protein
MGQYDRALSDLNQALKLSQDAKTYLVRGQVYAKKGQLSLAISDYNRAIELEPMYV